MGDGWLAGRLAGVVGRLAGRLAGVVGWDGRQVGWGGSLPSFPSEEAHATELGG